MIITYNTACISPTLFYPILEVHSVNVLLSYSEFDIYSLLCCHDFANFFFNQGLLLVCVLFFHCLNFLFFLNSGWLFWRLIFNQSNMPSVGGAEWWRAASEHARRCVATDGAAGGATDYFAASLNAALCPAYSGGMTLPPEGVPPPPGLDLLYPPSEGSKSKAANDQIRRFARAGCVSAAALYSRSCPHPPSTATCMNFLCWLSRAFTFFFATAIFRMFQIFLCLGMEHIPSVLSCSVVLFCVSVPKSDKKLHPSHECTEKQSLTDNQQN